MRTLTRLLTIVALLALLTGCAPGRNPAVGEPDSDGEIAGFFAGLWHGIIAPITFVVSLFVESVNIYEVHNSGAWYDLGYLLGLSASLGGSGGAAGRSSRRKAEGA